MTSALISLGRPADGEEHGVVFLRNHNCRDAAMFRSALEDRDVDLLIWPVGLIGYQMPLDTPFAVECGNECKVCGSRPWCWFQWHGPKVITVEGLVVP